MVFEYKMGLGLIAPLGAMFIVGPSGALVISWCSELFGTWQKKIFLDKFAWQMSRLATILTLGLFLTFVILGAGSYFLDLPFSGLKKQAQDFFLVAGALLTLSAILLVFYWSLWQKLKKNKGIHLLLGVLAVCCLKIFLVVLIFAGYFQAAPEAVAQQIFIAGFPLPPLTSLIYPLGLQTLILSVTAGASLALLYLLLRRNLDDFGRDYYRYVVILTAKWLIASLFLSFLPCVWVYFLLGKKILVSSLYLPGGVILASFVLIVVLNTVLIRSKQPLRLKGVMVCCFLLVWLFFAARLLSYLELANVSLGKVYFQSFVQNGWF